MLPATGCDRSFIRKNTGIVASPPLMRYFRNRVPDSPGRHDCFQLRLCTLEIYERCLLCNSENGDAVVWCQRCFLLTPLDCCPFVFAPNVTRVPHGHDRLPALFFTVARRLAPFLSCVASSSRFSQTTSFVPSHENRRT